MTNMGGIYHRWDESRLGAAYAMPQGVLEPMEQAKAYGARLG